MDFELLCHPSTAAAVPGRAAAAAAAAHYEKFQSWANENYGENSKSKTVTRAKYWRIVRCLAGDERSSADNAKFRFWIKAKGFRLGLAGGGSAGTGAPPLLCEPFGDGSGSEVPRWSRTAASVARTDMPSSTIWVASRS